MKKNLIILTLIITILIIAVLAIASAKSLKTDKEVRIFKPSKSFEKAKINKRIIADNINEEDIKLFRNKGCLIKHRLKDSVSFECPKNILISKVREARVFHVLDLEADVQIEADKVWEERIKGQGVDIVILDTGIDDGHIESSDSIKGQKDFVNNDDIAEDDNGHGTHVAGIITANGVYKNIDGSNDATGVAPSAGIYMLKVCDASGSCYEDDMIAAMEYAVDYLDAKIMSISIGGGNYGSHCDSDPLAAKVNEVVDDGFTVVVAAGNEGSGVSSPACASKAIAVGAVDKSGVVPWWSNRGTILDIIAPGVDILSTYSCLAAGDCGYYWYAYMSGTSMSTPLVSGVVALLLETKPTATTDEIKNALYSTADPATKCYECTRWSWNGKCRRQSTVTCTPEIQGAGIVNAYEAYLAIKPTGPECTEGETKQCGESNVGECEYGTQTCSNGNWGECMDAIYPTDEACDGLDNDCDGIVDQLIQQCGIDVGACEFGTQTCIEGIWRECIGAIEPISEICNGIDDDCDGELPLGEADADADNYMICEGDCDDNNPIVNPRETEICDEIDNNCNGEIDEGGVCEILTTKCWSAEYNYLKRSSDQFKKFCKCAQGSYGYWSYSYVRQINTAYAYVDSGNNENWETKSISTYYPAYRVKCTDGNWYETNKDYYFD